MAGQKLTLEIVAKGTTQTVGEIKNLKAAVEELDATTKATADNFATNISTAVQQAASEIKDLITLIQSVPAPAVPPAQGSVPGAVPLPDPLAPQVPTPSSPPPPSPNPAPANTPTNSPAPSQPLFDKKQYEADSDAIALSEKQRLIEIQNLLNEEAISEEEANKRRVESRKKAIAEQIEIEKRKVTQLQALPPFLSPDAEEDRQQQIRASLQRTADLQLQFAQDSSQALNAKPPSGLLKGIGEIAFGFNNALQAIQTFVAGGQQAYELLIGANERLNQQVLASAASISANADVFQAGVKIEDPTKAIQAIQPKIQAAIKQLELDTQSLVGVTSADTTEVFNTLLTNFGELQGQSKTINDSIDAGRVLTKSFVATLGSLQIPLDQASQEISSILTGEITDDSLLAKRIGLKADEIAKYKEQGVLVDKLVERMSAFTSANALAANSVGGITSNLKDVFELTLRTAGAPLLDELVKQLQVVYAFIQANQADFQNAASGAVSFVLGVFGELMRVLEAVGKAIAPVVSALGDALKQNIGEGANAATGGVKALADVLIGLINVASPLLQLAAGIINVLSGALSTEIGKFILLTGGIAAALAQAGAVISGLIAAVSGAAAAFAAATPAVIAFATASAAALAPLVALGAAIAAVVIAKKAFDMAQVNKSLDEFGAKTNQAGDDSIKLASQLKALNNAQKANGQLTAEQQAQKDKLASAAKAQIEQNNALITSIKATTPANEQQKASVAALEQQLTIANKALQRQIDGNASASKGAKDAAGNISIQTKALSDQGAAYDQIAKKVAGAIDKINKDGGGKLQVAEDAAKQLTELTQQQLQAGKITTETAINQLEKVTNNTKLSAETQLAAQEALTKVREQEGQKQVDAITAREDEINKKVADGRLSDETGERELTQVKIAEISKRIELNKQAIAAEQAAGRGTGAKAQELIKEQRSLSTQLAQEQAKAGDAAEAARLKDFEEQQTVLQSQLDGQKISQEKFAQESAKIQTSKIDEELKQIKEKRSQLSATDKEGLEALNAQEAKLMGERAKIVKSEQERIRKLRLEDIDEQKAVIDREFAERTITEEEYNKKSLENTLSRLDEQLKQTKEKRSQLAAGDKEGLERLAAEENKIRAERAKALEDAQKKELERRKRVLEDELDKTLDVVKRSETERLIETQKLLNAGVISEKDAAKQKLDLQQQTLEQELANAKKRAAELQKQPALSDPQAEAARQGEIRTALQSTADLQLKLLELEAQKQEQVRQLAIKAIEDRVAASERATQATVLGFQKQEAAIDKATRGLQSQVTAQEAITRSLDAQQKLIEARAGLADAARNLEIQGLEAQQQNLQRAADIQKELSSGQVKDSKLRAVLESELAKLGVKGATDTLAIAKQQAALADQLAAKQIAAKQAELERTKALQEIELKRNELAAKRAEIEARIAENQAKQKVLQAQQQEAEAKQQLTAAQAEIEKAQTIRDPEERKKAVAQAQTNLEQAQFKAQQATEGVGIAQSDLALQGENLKAAQENVAAQAELAKIARDTLATQQAGAQAQLQQAEAARQSAQNISLARAEAEKQAQNTGETASNLKSAASSASQISGGSGVGQRFKGGAMEAGQPYWVGEDPVTGKILPTSEIVVPNTQSYTVAAIKAQEWLRQSASPDLSPLRNAVPVVATPVPVESPSSRQLVREIGQLRSAIANLTNRSPDIKNEFHNVFARQDEQGYLDKIRRQTADSVGKWAKQAREQVSRGW